MSPAAPTFRWRLLRPCGARPPRTSRPAPAHEACCTPHPHPREPQQTASPKTRRLTSDILQPDAAEGETLRHAGPTDPPATPCRRTGGEHSRWSCHTTNPQPFPRGPTSLKTRRGNRPSDDDQRRNSHPNLPHTHSTYDVAQLICYACATARAASGRQRAILPLSANTPPAQVSCTAALFALPAPSTARLCVSAGDLATNSRPPLPPPRCSRRGR